MTIIPPLRQSGTSANITWYVADGWHVEVLWSLPPGRDDGRTPPTYHFRVYRLDADQHRYGDPINFTYEPTIRPAAGMRRLSEATATSKVRAALRDLGVDEADQQDGGDQ